MNFPRKIFFINFMTCALLAGFSFKVNTIDGVPLCPLCLIQLALYYLIAVFSLIFFVQLPQKSGKVAYATFIIIAALLGISAALRQVWMQHLPNASLYPCQPDAINYLTSVNYSALIKSFSNIYNSCALIDWSLFGLSIPTWSFMFFSGLAISGFLLYFHKNDPPYEINKTSSLHYKRIFKK